MKIDLKKISAEGVKLSGEETSSIIDIESETVSFKQPVYYQFRAALRRDTLLVRGRLETVGKFTCASCLREFERTIAVESFLVQKRIINRAGTIDLTEEIREDIILALPFKPLCRPDCSGICPVCGRDLNQGTCECTRDRSDSPFDQLNSKDYKP